MKNCKYEKRYPHTKKHSRCARDGSLRHKDCWEFCAHATKPWWVKLIKKVFK